jgi:hypothetical protein
MHARTSYVVPLTPAGVCHGGAQAEEHVLKLMLQRELNWLRAPSGDGAGATGVTGASPSPGSPMSPPTRRHAHQEQAEQDEDGEEEEEVGAGTAAGAGAEVVREQRPPRSAPRKRGRSGAD